VNKNNQQHIVKQNKIYLETQMLEFVRMIEVTKPYSCNSPKRKQMPLILLN